VFIAGISDVPVTRISSPNQPLSSLQTYSLSGWFETMLLYAPSRVNRERAATEQVHSIHCSIFRINSGVSGWYCWWCRCTRLFSDKSTLDDEIGTARLAQSVSFGINSSLSTAWGDFPATSTRSQSASWAINLDSWLSSSLQHDHQSLPKVSSSSGFVAVCFCDAATHA
jgi:hypothetical protein